MELIFEFAQDTEFHIIKTHDWLDWIADLVRNGQASLLYSYRDIRDVSVSLRQMFGHDDDSLTKALDKAIDVYYRVLGLEGSFIQRYEDLTHDLQQSVVDLGSCLDIAVTENEARVISIEFSIDAIAKRVGKKSMKTRVGNVLLKLLSRMEVPYLARVMGVPQEWRQRVAVSLKGYNFNDQFYPGHISETHGASVWRDKLSKDEARKLTDRYGNWLRDAGYDQI
ncbi:MAG: hypothetical protein KDJ54_03995 [Candidatus Competibacteraceae bacterium]|nr:hypothetical protein [Candidatus Competibacteraceae bacterium]